MNELNEYQRFKQLKRRMFEHFFRDTGIMIIGFVIAVLGVFFTKDLLQLATTTIGIFIMISPLINHNSDWVNEGE